MPVTITTAATHKHFSASRRRFIASHVKAAGHCDDVCLTNPAKGHHDKGMTYPRPLGSRTEKRQKAEGHMA